MLDPLGKPWVGLTWAALTKSVCHRAAHIQGWPADLGKGSSDSVTSDATSAEIFPLQGLSRINFLLCWWGCFSQSYFFLSSLDLCPSAGGAGVWESHCFPTGAPPSWQSQRTRWGVYWAPPSRAAPLLHALQSSHAGPSKQTWPGRRFDGFCSLPFKGQHFLMPFPSQKQPESLSLCLLFFCSSACWTLSCSPKQKR